MTQENENSVPSGVTTLENAAARPKKTAARKTPVKKASPAKPAAKKTPAAAQKTPASEKTAASPEAASPKKGKTGTSAAKPAARKASPKSGPASEKAPETAMPEKAPETAMPEKPVAKPKPRPRGRATAKKTSGSEMKEADAAAGEAEKPAPVVQASPTAPVEPGESAAAPSQPETHSVPAEGETSSESAPRSSSRRSRRGGRRRNKKTAQNRAEEASTGTEDAVQEADAAADAQNGEARAKPAKEPAGKKETAAPKGKPAGKAPGKAAPEPESEPEPAKTAPGKRKMFISVLSGELVEVVLAEDGLVQEYYVEMQHQAKVKGNIYKGVVSNLDANLQAAFVSYAGGVKNGFLQIDEVHPEYYVAHHEPMKGRKYPPIQKVLRPGQEILVQVVKEPAGTKGAFLTSYLSLPGRFLVLTPGREQIGVSRKVENDAERAHLKTIIEGLAQGAGLGVIVRTVSTGASKASLTRDMQFLKRLWKEVRGRGQTQPAPSLIYEELDLSTRAVRDYLTDDVQEVWVDDEATAKQVAELASLLFPKKQNLVQVHAETHHSLFERFSLQKELDLIHAREVPLPSGGRLVIDGTEALTAIDINSGRSGGKTNFEDMAFRTNLEAARAIPAQLRLRDIGGQIVVDFIEMRDRDHWREIEKAIRNGMKGDRARYDVGKIGPFGMLEIVRQRIGSSAISISTEPCPCCKGTGIRRNMEWRAMQSLRDIARALRQAAAGNQPSLAYPAEAELAFYLLNAKRSIVQKMEEDSGVRLAIRPAGG